MFTVPTTTVEELETFLPGKTPYQDIDELLIDIGKNPERSFPHHVIAKIFSVPQSTLGV